MVSFFSNSYVVELHQAYSSLKFDTISTRRFLFRVTSRKLKFHMFIGKLCLARLILNLDESLR